MNVRVRIPVAVAADGTWQVAECSESLGIEDVADHALSGLREGCVEETMLYIVEADLPLPSAEPVSIGALSATEAVQIDSKKAMQRGATLILRHILEERHGEFSDEVARILGNYAEHPDIGYALFGKRDDDADGGKL